MLADKELACSSVFYLYLRKLPYTCRQTFVRGRASAGSQVTVDPVQFLVEPGDRPARGESSHITHQVRDDPVKFLIDTSSRRVILIFFESSHLALTNLTRLGEQL